MQLACDGQWFYLGNHPFAKILPGSASLIFLLPLNKLACYHMTKVVDATNNPKQTNKCRYLLLKMERNLKTAFILYSG